MYRGRKEPSGVLCSSGTTMLIRVAVSFGKLSARSLHAQSRESRWLREMIFQNVFEWLRAVSRRKSLSVKVPWKVRGGRRHFKNIWCSQGRSVQGTDVPESFLSRGIGERKHAGLIVLLQGLFFPWHFSFRQKWGYWKHLLHFSQCDQMLTYKWPCFI